MNRAQLDKQPADVASMFDDVASRYDLTNDVMTFGLARAWRRTVARAVAARPGERVLDLAAGTGTSSATFTRHGAEVVAGDISEGMLSEGRRRHPEIDFIYADAMDLPFTDDRFDVVTISFGIRNIHDVDVALAEMLRVLKPGGRLVVCEFSTPTFPPFSVAYKEYLMRAIPAMTKVVSSNPEAYRYLAESIRAWPDQDEFAHQILDAGFDQVKYRNLSGGIVAIHHALKPAGSTAGRA
ncbi:2-octaprenyl-6-methoxy-1,4-benzoquinone methylase /demethylmenaquinone methyltransferase [Brevibacterium sanguinis]|uniref:Demethylmenaquinone methyltransferase n=2 Tax=Brevibacterium TaxID=1696 RepID=A0A366IEH5_9MICO|nr:MULTISPECIES: demethylmenaquinone methyltransferase [Brevibacterium]RBP63179.1 2-octaprenyl-6-methoxy-1,4-benzoquinone methylase /demethylmenaquinone methyltransferase [Brevibacterium sanguinis]RBP69645.1 2-octaprenyl-6-methoxy-1,4-benzoquinone methylase /demethylmenaquinone methyltransferase [Brevibacterium celere]